MKTIINTFAPGHEEIGVGQMINSRYKDYAKYVMHRRAIPSLIDGLKPGQRKALWTATQQARSKKIKTAALSGYVVGSANYHHGDASMSATITNMAATWCNNVPLFASEGNFGSREVPEAGAPRYTFVRLSKDFDRWFKDDHVSPRSEDPEDPEPQFYLPIVPWVLVNGVSGIAIGFATEILPRDPRQLAAWVRSYLDGSLSEEKILDIEMTPKFPGFKGEVHRDPQNPRRWVTVGSYENVKRGCLRVTELPWGTDREGYVKKLETLVERGTISAYTDLGRLQFEIRAPKIDKWSREQVISKLKLQTSMTENIVVVNEEGELVQFTSPNALLLRWIKRRLAYYDLKIEKRIEHLDMVVSRTEAKVRFVSKVLEGKIEFMGKTRASLREEIQRQDTVMKVFVEDLLRMNVSSFCNEELENLLTKRNDAAQEMKEWGDRSPESVHLEDLEKVV